MEYPSEITPTLDEAAKLTGLSQNSICPSVQCISFCVKANTTRTANEPFPRLKGMGRRHNILFEEGAVAIALYEDSAEFEKSFDRAIQSHTFQARAGWKLVSLYQVEIGLRTMFDKHDA